MSQQIHADCPGLDSYSQPVRVSTECHSRSMLTVMDLILTLRMKCVFPQCHNRFLLTVLDLI
ncbi:hypothetical protein WG66_007556, partial [Moniliophthora roreri]